jgi:hypothetical protein
MIPLLADDPSSAWIWPQRILVIDGLHIGVALGKIVKRLPYASFPTGVHSGAILSGVMENHQSVVVQERGTQFDIVKSGVVVMRPINEGKFKRSFSNKPVLAELVI